MKQRLLVIVLLLLTASLIAALVLVPRLNRSHALTGYVEGEALYLAAPVSGAVAQIYVQRGDRVKAGDRLFVVDPKQLAAQRQQAQAEVGAAQAQAQDARKGLRPLELAVYDANIAAAQARAQDAAADMRRVAPLVRKGIYAPARLDDARAALQTANAQLAAARRQRDAATLGAREGQVQAADSRVAQAQAGLSAADARLSDLAPVAPSDGRVEDVFFQQGEWSIANQPVLSLLPDDRIKLRFFIPEQSLSAYRIGRVVRFACDGCAKGLSAKITFVSPRPEFTPPIIYSREARDRLVYLVEARPSARLNPGQPVDVTPLEPVR
ncbi:HlyD family efflux transporter periplasmic adaptor subunit [Phenylobacterium sp. 20VBR1]|uniref:HlyD family efflux transporter periplasmic adaptor subunit n=1 Tax=Phenylobacterium glaciei TaxID=2803784 RepID=A0A941D023_9CAUL|nr:HlyD family efflux transporter periplasmic adaptor subunit [Phenylobacterium glaciei]MBR7618804.1 HlyD family efflux transporter periplasmic adaptor subunit [Phenylobacterium glaciei]